jgi:hypothetical protein
MAGDCWLCEWRQMVALHLFLQNNSLIPQLASSSDQPFCFCFAHQANHHELYTTGWYFLSGALCFQQMLSCLEPMKKIFQKCTRTEKLLILNKLFTSMQVCIYMNGMSATLQIVCHLDSSSELQNHELFSCYTGPNCGLHYTPYMKPYNTVLYANRRIQPPSANH